MNTDKLPLVKGAGGILPLAFIYEGPVLSVSQGDCSLAIDAKKLQTG